MGTKRKRIFFITATSDKVNLTRLDWYSNEFERVKNEKPLIKLLNIRNNKEQFRFSICEMGGGWRTPAEILKDLHYKLLVWQITDNSDNLVIITRNQFIINELNILIQMDSVKKYTELAPYPNINKKLKPLSSIDFRNVTAFNYDGKKFKLMEVDEYGINLDSMSKIHNQQREKLVLMTNILLGNLKTKQKK